MSAVAVAAEDLRPLAALLAVLQAEQADTPVADPLAAQGWQPWLTTLFPAYVAGGFAPRHAELWDWVWRVEAAARPAPFVALWPRGGAKSTSAELACVALGARQRRRYGLYLCETQDQADDHIANIAALLESRAVEQHYPALASRLVGKYGASKGWRRNRVRTSSGLTVDAIGLDAAARGAKLEDTRPDLLIIDDIDGELDTPGATARKVKILTHKILPAGAPDLAVLAVQNMVLPDGIFAMLVDGRADFLADRLVSGPFPALDGFAYEQREGRYVITAGVPTWHGQNLARCQDMLDDMGLTAFLAECQHEVDAPPGGMFDHLDFRHCQPDEVPDLVRTTVWVDPAVTATDDSDSHAIQVDGLAPDGTIYRLWSWEQRATPEDSLRRAIAKAVEFHAPTVGIETDQGGDTWQSVYARAVEQLGLKPQTAPKFRSEKAGAGYGPKAHRASQMLAGYERGKIVHVLGTHQVLERSLRRFPKTKPYDLVDAAFWGWHDLSRPVRVASVAVGGTPTVPPLRFDIHSRR